MNSKDYKKTIIDKLSVVLKERGYKRKGNIFSYSNGDLTYFIGLQSSQSSTANMIKVTVNTEIASAVISKLHDTSLPIEQQRHYDRRIGYYLEGYPDIWWTIDSLDAADSAATEIVEILNSRVIPHFEEFTTTADLAALWRRGGYIGIIEGQRKNYLSLLEQSNQ